MNYYDKIPKEFEKSIILVQSMIHLNDPYTSFHHDDTVKLTLKIARKLNLEEDRLPKLIAAAALHDIGKQGIPSTILSKPTRLSEHEFNLVKEHVNLGVDLLRKIDFDDDVIRFVSEHHEKLDGSGYPNGLIAGQISFEGQILAVADIVSALTSKRTYRNPTPHEKVIEILLSDTPHKLNEDAVAAAIEILKHDYWSAE